MARNGGGGDGDKHTLLVLIIASLLFRNPSSVKKDVVVAYAIEIGSATATDSEGMGESR